MNGILDNFVAEIIGRTVGHTGPNTDACKVVGTLATQAKELGVIPGEKDVGKATEPST